MITIPEVQREVFKKHTINTCIVKLDFEDVFDISDFAKDIIQSLSPEFPNRRKENQVTVEFNLTPTQMGLKKSDEVKSVPVFTFFNEDKNTIKLSNEFFIIEYKKYTHFDDLFKIFALILKKFEEKFPNNNYKRLGLRKINMFIAPEDTYLANFTTILNPFYTHHLSAGKFHTQLFEDFHKMSFNDNHTECILQFRIEKGIVDTIAHRRFILDIDYFTKDISFHTILDQLRSLNEKIYNLYSWSITEGYKEELRRG